MKPNRKPKQEGPPLTGGPLDFDEAMRRALKVKPPPEGWADYERRLKQERKRRKPAKVP
jgi:hypothetical protein